MKSHAAVVDANDSDRVRQIHAKVVEEDVAEPAPQDDAEGDPGDEVADLLAGRTRARPP